MLCCAALCCAVLCRVVLCCAVRVCMACAWLPRGSFALLLSGSLRPNIHFVLSPQVPKPAGSPLTGPATAMRAVWLIFSALVQPASCADLDDLRGLVEAAAERSSQLVSRIHSLQTELSDLQLRYDAVEAFTIADQRKHNRWQSDVSKKMEALRAGEPFASRSIDAAEWSACPLL